MPAQKSTKFHLVLSTKDLQDPNPLEKYLIKQKAEEYIIALEHGTTGHPHLDVYVSFPKERRSDLFKRSVLNLYDIPENEQRNCKCTVNKIDPFRLWYIGYASKENNILKTNISYEDIQKGIKYYETHKEHIDEQKKLLIPKGAKNMTVDDFARLAVGLATQFYAGQRPVASEIEWFLKNRVLLDPDVRKRLLFSTIQRINLEKLAELYILPELQFQRIDKKEDRLLDCPPFSPQSSKLVTYDNEKMPLI